MTWVKDQNKRTLSGDKTKERIENSELYKRSLAILDSKEKIPHCRKWTEDVYVNFWRDADHVRGIWRRCDWDEYVTEEPTWTTMLDLDTLGEKEGKSWVWSGRDELSFHILER